MKYIISGTNRPGSRTLQIAQVIQQIYRDDHQENVEIIDLNLLPMNLLDGTLYGGTLPPAIAEAVQKINAAEGLIIVCPEYNGSMPGVLKTFIDYWKYPDSFEYRPICFIGLGGRFGGVRPIEHLQQVFGYRNAYCFPFRVFLTDVWKCLQGGAIQDPVALDLLKQQAALFRRFVAALKQAGLDANTSLQSKSGNVKP